jgi:hypothetical protein
MIVLVRGTPISAFVAPFAMSHSPNLVVFVSHDKYQYELKKFNTELNFFGSGFAKFCGWAVGTGESKFYSFGLGRYFWYI